MDLRPHQVRLKNLVRKAFAEGKRRIVCVMPCGAGKTVSGCDFAKSHLEKGGEAVLWITHREELLQQSSAALLEAGLTTGVTVATVQTLLAREWTPPASLIIFDECSHAVSESWVTILQKYPHAIILGLTATPERGDKIGLGDFFDHLVVGATYSELRASGVLVPCETLATKFALKSQTIAQRPVDAYLEYAKGLKTVVFSSNTQAAEEHLQQFLDAGIRAAFIHYKSTDREEILQSFGNGQLDVIINLSLLTEGWNVPAVECCILARTCGSIGLYIQMVGRVLRASPGKQRGLLLDLTGQSRKHGPPDQDWIFSLDGKPIRRKGEKVDARFCAVCGMVIDAGASVCSDCGTGPDPLRAPTVTGEKLEKYAGVRKRSAESKRTHYFQMLDKCAEEGHHTGRAYHRYKAVYAEEPEWNWTRDWKKLHANAPKIDRNDNRLE